MASPYHARLVKREFLNRPGFHGSAFVNAYVEDTSERELPLPEGGRAHNIHPRVILELSDCSGRVSYELEVHSNFAVENSQHKLEMIRAAVEQTAKALAEEARWVGAASRRRAGRAGRRARVDRRRGTVIAPRHSRPRPRVGLEISRGDGRRG